MKQAIRNKYADAPTKGCAIDHYEKSLNAFNLHLDPYNLASLEAKVKAVNIANTVANQLGPILWEQFKDYVGRKVTRLDDGLLKSVKVVVPDVKTWQTYSGYSI